VAYTIISNKHRHVFKWSSIILILLFSCNSIETGETLSKDDITYIKNLGLLDDNETIIKFYSEYKNRVAGNFISNKRIGEYWVDKKEKNRNSINYAFYKDIKNIDTVYYAGATYAPYMLITKMDNTRFKVNVDGTKKEIKSFFEDGLKRWHQAQATSTF